MMSLFWGSARWAPLRPATDGPAGGVKVALYRAPIPSKCTADTIDRTVRPEEIQTMQTAISGLIPALDTHCIEAVTCLYTNTPDKNFILSRHPRHEQVFIACGFSGHGFKFSSVVGEILTDLVVRNTISTPKRVESTDGSASHPYQCGVGRFLRNRRDILPTTPCVWYKTCNFVLEFLSPDRIYVGRILLGRELRQLWQVTGRPHQFYGRQRGAVPTPGLCLRTRGRCPAIRRAERRVRSRARSPSARRSRPASHDRGGGRGSGARNTARAS